MLLLLLLLLLLELCPLTRVCCGFYAAGEWSIITATMSTGGNAIRVFTTLQLTHDPVLLAGESQPKLQAISALL